MDLLQGRIVIVGAGQAGARAAEALRAAGHAGPITLVGEEEHLPYERPQLSKALLLHRESNPIFIRNQQEWSDLGIALKTSSRVIAADGIRRVIGLESGEELPFDRLLLATGTRVRRLAEIDDGPLPVRYLRGMADALVLREELQAGRGVVVVGGGVVGLEVASAAIARGCRVTVLEKAPRLLPRVGSRAVAEYVQGLHESRGAEIVCRAVIERVTGDGVEVNGRLVFADLILVGVGVDPATGLATQLGLDAAHGIRVAPNGATDADGVFAAGDVATQWSRCHSRWMRVENWANAQNQAIATAKTMAGAETAYDAPPWFWSDQYDANIQILGNPAGGSEYVRGEVTTGRFVTVSVTDGEVVGGVTVNSPRDMAVLRRLVASRKTVRASDLENPAFELKRALTAQEGGRR